MGRKKLKEKSVNTKTKMGEIQEGIPDLIFYLDKDHSVLSFNQAVMQAFDEHNPAKIAQKWRLLFEELQETSLGDSLEKACLEDKPITHTIFVESLQRNYQFTATPVKDLKGAYIGLICIAQDLNSHVHPEEGLNTLQSQLENLLEHIDDRIWVIDREYRLIYANSVMHRSIAKRIGKELKYGGSIFWEGMDDNLVRSWKDSYDRALVGEAFSIEANTLFVTETAYVTCQFKPIVSDDGKVAGVMVHGRDVTRHVNAEEILRESEAKYRQLFEAESDSVFFIENENGQILEANSAAEKLYGYSRKELLSMKNTDLSSEPEQTEEVTKNSPINPDAVVSIPTRFHRKKDGTIFPVEITGRFFQWRGRNVHIAAIRDITERKQAQEALMRIQIQMRQKMQEIEMLQEKLQELAIRDPLTNLYNRRFMEDTLLREIAQAQRENQSIGIIMIDIDNFKSFNDTYGHQNGDLALELVGRLLNKTIRSGDIACRYGGEEFVIIMPKASYENTIKRGKQIKVQFESMPIPVGVDQQGLLTISLGISNYPMHGLNRDTILNNADMALYKAKRLGKNRVVAFGEGNGTEVD